MDIIEVKMYTAMQRIRLFEERINEEFIKQEMRTPMHSYIGQEGIAVGVCMNLSANDVIYSNHRGHGHYLAKGGGARSLIAELYNRKTGCSKGYGGSMHIMDLKAGVALTSSIVAGTVPIATGSALAFQLKKEPRVAIAFFGDGASEEGCVYESICFAALKKLPIVYVCENNLYAMYTAMGQREPLQNISDKFKTIVPSEIIEGNDVETVFRKTERAILKARNGGGPSFLEFNTYRIRNHYESPNSEDFWYRSRKEWEYWRKKCPIMSLKLKILERKLVSIQELEKIDEEILKEVDDAFVFAQNSPFPSADEFENFKVWE